MDTYARQENIAHVGRILEGKRDFNLGHQCTLAAEAIAHERARRERLEAALKRVRALCWCQPPMKEPCPICKALEDQE